MQIAAPGSPRSRLNDHGAPGKLGSTAPLIGAKSRRCGPVDPRAIIRDRLEMVVAPSRTTTIIHAVTHGIPLAEVQSDTALVRSQHPDLAHEEPEVVGHGWDCVMVTIGADLAARLPRRASAAPLAAIEHRWLPELGPRLPLPVPVPQRVGRPGEGHRWSWSFVPWVEGISADRSALDEAAAVRLAWFFVALHRPAPNDAPHHS